MQSRGIPKPWGSEAVYYVSQWHHHIGLQLSGSLGRWECESLVGLLVNGWGETPAEFTRKMEMTSFLEARYSLVLWSGTFCFFEPHWWTSKYWWTSNCKCFVFWVQCSFSYSKITALKSASQITKDPSLGSSHNSNHRALAAKANSACFSLLRTAGAQITKSTLPLKDQGYLTACPAVSQLHKDGWWVR